MMIGWIYLQIAFFYSGPTDGGEPIALSTDMVLISHAGAGLPAAVYSNSRQALDAAAQRGISKVEMDFAPTEDGRYVASHDWRWFYVALHPEESWLPAALATYLPPPVPSYAQFMNKAMRDNLAPVDLSYLSTWLGEHPDTHLITDTKFSNLAFLRRLTQINGFPLNQVIPQIYSRDEFAPVSALGFRHIIYTLYRDPVVTTDEVIAFASRNDLTVTMPLKRASEAVLQAYKKAGIRVYVHTVNNSAEATRLHRWGATGVYTDFLFDSRQTAQTITHP